MIINQPLTSKADNSIKIESEIVLETAGKNLKLYFEYPHLRMDQIRPASDSFLVSLLLVAMKYGEDIKINGKISPKLAYNLQTYQKYFKNFIKELKIVNILPKDYVKYPSIVEKGSMCSFSGGVDSFYTFFSHLPKNLIVDAYQARYIYFVRGFDIGNDDKSSFEICKKSYGKLAKKYNIHLIEAETNFRDIFKNILSWEILHASVLAGSALNIKLTKSFIIPSSHKFDYSKSIWGSQQVTDFLLSTEYMEIIHHGADKSRAEKIFCISKRPETYNNLRVCWENINGLNNCSKCEKCLRTMAVLEMIGSLKYYKTFKNYSAKEILKKIEKFQNFSKIPKTDYDKIDLLIKKYYADEIESFSRTIRAKK